MDHNIHTVTDNLNAWSMINKLKSQISGGVSEEEINSGLLDRGVHVDLLLRIKHNLKLRHNQDCLGNLSVL